VFSADGVAGGVSEGIAQALPGGDEYAPLLAASIADGADWAEESPDSLGKSKLKAGGVGRLSLAGCCSCTCGVEPVVVFDSFSVAIWAVSVDFEPLTSFCRSFTMR